MTLQEEITRRRTFAIISHPDAGKTTLTEKLLLFGGAIHVAGAVKSNKIKKGATSDFMEIERQRGISVATAVMGFEYKGTKINILDTPGHEDFAEDTYRTLTAVDSVIIVIDGAKGVESQTRKLMEVCRMRSTPVIVFINKLDRPSKEPFDLLDEVEKAHPDVFNILLQVLDDGHITDSQGRKVDFKNTIIIMTSNAGAQAIVEPKKLGFASGNDEKQNYERMKGSVMEEVRRIFKPEFLNRIDETIVFRALNKDDMKQIVGLMTKELAKRCETQLGITLVVRDAAKQYIVDKAYDPKYGARPLRRKIQDEIEDPLAEKLLDGSIRRGDEVIVTTKKNAIFLEPKKK